MLLLGLCILSVTVAYSAMLMYFAKGWMRAEGSNSMARSTTVSVIVAARNEASNIENCLKDLIAQDYPQELTQIIMVDDGSEDDTAALAERIALMHAHVQVLHLEVGQGKKMALQHAIENSSSTLMATVDADCRVPSAWLSTMVAHQQHSFAPMVLGPVVLAPAKTLFERIQALEFLAIMGITGGAVKTGHPLMANGANLLFERNAFNQAGGYSGTENPSGDDVFLMLKLKAYGQVVFVKDDRAIVSTAPQVTFNDFWNQRKRWLSKKSGYDDTSVKAVALLTYVTNLGCLMALIVLCIASEFDGSPLFASALMLKFVVDLLFIRMVRKELQPKMPMWAVLPAQLFILFYVSFIGMFGNVRSYKWKGRDIRVNE